ncbi:serine hydrolase [Psychroserpens sp. SPM9]|uniref:serine hydrolase domain-containing protein n=1 Tax=Psychroserpens sp. SPM9 TaxID=2975598 RepID=UPI0021A2725E|nr:serine hydrolase domain-containing protein [Psychroserpens sp. SPM9]MDG5490925.1 serine hydrolase [Psychroserpens sp. SPM9]
MLRAYCLLALWCISIKSTAQSEPKVKIDALLQEYEIQDAPGLAIRVLQDTTILYSRGIGSANLDYNIKNSDSTIFSLASISKQFTAAAIWALIQESKLNLEDPITLFFPGFPSYGKSIQIKHLLNHSSGIRNYHTLMHLSGFDYDKNYYDNSYVLELAQRQKNLNHFPGEKITYSNTNYNLLALIVEQVSGQNLDTYLKTKILNPLGMKNTFVKVTSGKPIKNRAIGYQKQEDGFVYNTSNQLSYGAGSMGSNLIDMTLWAQMLNEETPKFKDLAKFLKTSEVLASGQEATYTRGLMLDHYKGFKTFSHSGFGFGGQTQFISVPDKKISIIILTNLQSINPTPIAYQILNLFISSEEKELIEIDPFEPYEPQNLNQFIGDYIEINSDMTMQILVENDTLKAMGSKGKTKIPLLQNSSNEFVRHHAQNVKYNFKKTPTYDMTISFGGTPFYFKRIKLIKQIPNHLEDYTGNYFSEELQATYHFFIENDTLKLSYAQHDTITLHPILINQFGNGDRTLYHFISSNNNNITGMLLSCDGQVSNIEFVKD